MTRKIKPDTNLDDEMWINPRSQFRGTDGDRAWDNAGNISPQSGERFLELADIALGVKKPAAKRKKAAAAGTHSAIEKAGS